MKRSLGLLSSLLLCGCTVLPELAHQPTLHNPFPQLSKVAVAPFFNLSGEPTLDGRRFALAYFNELQQVPGFEVVPIGVVEQAIRDTNNRLASPEDARRLAQDLGVDAVVIGAVTDYSPYYPPRCALQVEWYAANPGFHAIPPGYGLPWGTSEEQQIPGPLIFEAEMALAKAQLATQTPRCPTSVGEAVGSGEGRSGTPDAAQPVQPGLPSQQSPSAVKPAGYGQAVGLAGPGGMDQNGGRGVIPPDWPDPRGFIPKPPSPTPEPCYPNAGPVLRHTQIYNGHDSRFTEALESFYFFQDDARFGGWQNYLQRSDDFIRFCCRMHIWEMLSARGGAGETRVVFRWKKIR